MSALRCSLIAALGVAGCVSAALPEDLVIECASADGCPAGYVCRNSLGRCLPASAIDGDAPSLTAAEGPTPAIAGIDATVALVIEVSDALLVPPSAVLGGRPMLLDDADEGARRYAFSYRPSGSEAQDLVPITVTLLDTGGDEAAGLAAGAVRFDFDPPGFQGGPALSRSHARSDADDVTLTLTLDEDPAQGAGAAAVVEPAGLFVESARDGRALTLAFAPPPGAPPAEGPLPVTITAVDAAGNRSAPTSAGTLVIDDTAPAPTNAPAALDRPQRPGDVVSLALTFDEPLAGAPQARLTRDDGAELSLTTTGDGADFAFAALLPAGGADGPATLTVDGIVDRAGNAGAAVVVAADVDGTAPSLLGDATLTPPRAGASQEVILDLVVANDGEPLAADPQVEARSGTDEPLAFERIGGDGDTVHQYRLVTPAEGAAPFYDVVVRMLDIAGNGNQEIAAVLEIDTEPPSVELTASADGYRLNELVRVVLVADETLDGPPALQATSTSDAGDVIALVPEDAAPGRLSYAYTHVAGAGDDDGTYALDAFTVRDEALNAVVVGAGAREFEIDTTTPTFAGAPELLAPAGPFGAGDTITVRFVLDAAVAAVPSVILGTVPALAFDCASADGGVTWTCTLPLPLAGGGPPPPPPPLAPEGAVPIAIEVLDEAQNRLTAGLTAQLDFTAPTLTPSLSDTLVRAGDTLVFRVDANEALTLPPTLGGSAAAFFGAPDAGGSPSSATWTKPVGALADGSYTVSVAASDLTGNAAPATAPPLSFSVDSTPPALSPIELRRADGTPAARFSRVAGFSRIVAAVDVDDDGAVVAASLDGAPLTCSQPPAPVECVYDVDAGDTPGAHFIVVAAGDALGNTDVESAVVQLDFTPPALVGSASFSRSDAFAPAVVDVDELLVSGARADFSPAPLELRFAFSLDEPAVDQPTVTLGGAGGGALAAPETGDDGDAAFTFRFTVPASGNDGPSTVSAVVADDVGNSASRTLGTLTFDRAAPTLPQPAVDALLFRRVPWGDQAHPAPAAELDVPPAVPAALEADARLHVFDGAVPANASRLATLLQDAPVSLLAVTGLPLTVFAAAQDRAGNVSSTLEVQEHEWIASFGGKVAGSSVENPHELARVFWATSGRQPHPDDVDVPLDDAAFAAAVDDDGAALSAATRLSYVDDNGDQRSMNRDWQRFTGQLPPDRRFAAVAYDRVREEIVLRGGDQTEGTRCDAQSGQLCSGGDVCVGFQANFGLGFCRRRAGTAGTLCSANPPPASGCTCIDSLLENTNEQTPVCEEMVALDDTWIFDGVVWGLVETGTAERTRAAMAYDPGADVVVTAGGHDYNTSLAPTIDSFVGVWDGIAWSDNTFPDATQCNELQAGWGAAFDGTRVIRRGGLAAAQTCRFDVAAGRWVSVGSGGPSARVQASVTEDRLRGRVVMFGGNNGTLQEPATTFGELWTWNPTTLTWANPVTNATPQKGHGAAYDPLRDRVVFAGGECGVTALDGLCAMSSVLEWDGAGLITRVPNNSNQNNGCANGSNLCRPTPVRGVAVAYHEAADALVFIGGQAGNHQTVEDAWLLRDGRNRRPALVATFAFAAAQVARDKVSSVTVTANAGGVGQAGAGGTTVTTGAAVAAYDDGERRFVELGNNTAPLATPAALGAVRTGAAAVDLIDPASLLLRARLQPRAPQGSDDTPLAEVRADSVSVAVRFRR